MMDFFFDGLTLTPCTHGWFKTSAALRRSVASRTRSLEMRSLALSVMWDQSLSGNSYFPCWMLSNRLLWGQKCVHYQDYCNCFDELQWWENKKHHIYSALVNNHNSETTLNIYPDSVSWQWRQKEPLLCKQRVLNIYSCVGWGRQKSVDKNFTWQVLQVSPRSQPQSVPQWPVNGGLPLSRM